jgi:PST family polysaccharide transporter
VGAALLLGAGLVITGPIIERFFAFAGLGVLIQLQSLVLILAAFGVVPISRLMRRLAFNRLATIEVATRVLEGAVSVILAHQGYGALALVVGTVSAKACYTCMCWALGAGRMSMSFSIRSAKSLLSYGTGILFSRACIAFGHRADVLIIGHRLGPDVLGLYQRAYHLTSVPLSQFTIAANEALFPAMAKIQDDDQRFRQGFLGTVGLTSILTFPLLTMLWTSADILIPFLYGPKWNGTVPILTSLALVGYIRSAESVSSTVAKARGRVMAQAAYQAVTMISLVLFVFLGSSVGIQGAILGICMANLLSLFLMTRLALLVTGVNVLEWLGTLRTTLISSAVMGLTMLGLKAILIGHVPVVVLLATISVFGVVAYIICLAKLITTREYKLLERLSQLLPLRLKNLFLLCIGSRARLIYE